jgi:hypothetical protein
MKMRSTFPTLLLFLLAATTATTQSSSATAPDHRSTAFGKGAFIFFNGLRNEAWSFSFEATANKNRKARGRAIFNISENSVETQVVVKIDCMSVTEFSGFANAVMTGTVLHSDDPDVLKGAQVIFAADDNSNAPTIRADIVTPLFVTFISKEEDCSEVGQPLTMFQLPPDSITIEP